MAASSYDAALARLLAHEGGYVNHPSDPGGPTKFGITLADYRRHAKPGATAADVRAMTVGEAKAIYRARYWDAQRCDELPAGVDYAVFDYGVNSGTGRSGKVLRRVLWLSDALSTVTDGVLAAVQGRNAADLVDAICAERLAFLRRLKTWPTFGAGWTRRVAEVKTAALSMARARVHAETGASPAPGKGAVPLNTAGQRGAAGGIAAAGAATAHQAHQAGVRPLAVIAIAAAAIALAAAAWLAWRWRQRRLQES